MSIIANTQVSETTLNKINMLIAHTNMRLVGWYENAKLDYNVDGVGSTKVDLDNNEIIIDYTENGVEKTWSVAFYVEYLESESINYFYNVWMEQS